MAFETGPKGCYTCEKLFLTLRLRKRSFLTTSIVCMSKTSGKKVLDYKPNTTETDLYMTPLQKVSEP
jgi:hypothetical protein